MKSFQNAVRNFLKEATWLDESDQAIVTGLEHCALELDNDFKVTLLTEYNKTVKYLLERKPVEEKPVEEEKDELGSLLDG